MGTDAVASQAFGQEARRPLGDRGQGQDPGGVVGGVRVRGQVGDVLAALQANPKAEKGEYCVVLQWNDVIAPPKPPSTLTLEAQLFDGLVRGLTLRQSMEALTAAGERKNAVYAAGLRVKAMLKESE